MEMDLVLELQELEVERASDDMKPISIYSADCAASEISAFPPIC